ncbi:filamentous hemagglutinin N-terminal domain-containing protein, partial [cf. Phormidesmis sp. LEGE 11477]|uniref:two-partner secretion domain-containing protein n=1 Tax=cf. Phormidesmis sp. LEGE 11477 TaxID=1828680 RepID=UPI001882BBFA
MYPLVRPFCERIAETVLGSAAVLALGLAQPAKAIERFEPQPLASQSAAQSTAQQSVARQPTAQSIAQLTTQLTTQLTAQLNPDLTLGSERSTLIEAPSRTRIDGGAARGSALFHSFSEFNVGIEQQVYFINPEGITNILTRITGEQASNILGTLGVEGSANLFLMNPNGIVFGEEAQLDILGSFAATTADQLWVAGTEFSALRPETLPLLTMSVSPGIQYGRRQPQSAIENRAVLAIGPQQQLVLNGGTVRQLGQILAPAGLVELSGETIALVGTVDTRSPDGTVGSLLIDPKNILIQAGELLNGDAIGTALVTNDVIFQADNDITINDDIASTTDNDLTFLSGRSLTLSPDRSVQLNGGDFTAQINAPSVNPGDRDPGVAAFTMGLGAQIITNGGAASIAAADFDETSQIDTAMAAIVTGSRTGNGGAITLSALGDVATGLLDSRSEAGNGGDINLSSEQGAIATNNNLFAEGTSQAGDISLTAAGDIAVNGKLTAGSFGAAG